MGNPELENVAKILYDTFGYINREVLNKLDVLLKLDEPKLQLVSEGVSDLIYTGYLDKTKASSVSERILATLSV